MGGMGSKMNGKKGSNMGGFQSFGGFDDMGFGGFSNFQGNPGQGNGQKFNFKQQK